MAIRDNFCYLLGFVRIILVFSWLFWIYNDEKSDNKETLSWWGFSKKVN
tara:strand:- start:328 stop:474 length:147 start_codon:yes stop_codon:yes gene_type:complete